MSSSAEAHHIYKIHLSVPVGLKGEVVLFTSSQLELMFLGEDVLGCISLMKWSYEVYSTIFGIYESILP